MANIIADIAGQYKTLMALIEKMPDDLCVSIGDMCDRGPDSRAVLEWFMANGKAILGNHEHMMLDYCEGTNFYDEGVWEYNGGTATLNSFNYNVPDSVIQYIKTLPLYMEIDDCLISHAFISPAYNLEKACKLFHGFDDQWNTHFIDQNETSNYKNVRPSDYSIIWSRSEPHRMPYKLQIAGHNSHMGLRKFADDQGQYAICIDDSRSKMLTGIHLPSLQVYQQEFLE